MSGAARGTPDPSPDRGRVEPSEEERGDGCASLSSSPPLPADGRAGVPTTWATRSRATAAPSGGVGEGGGSSRPTTATRRGIVCVGWRVVFLGEGSGSERAENVCRPLSLPSTLPPSPRRHHRQRRCPACPRVGVPREAPRGARAPRSESVGGTRARREGGGATPKKGAPPFRGTEGHAPWVRERTQAAAGVRARFCAVRAKEGHAFWRE